MYIPILSLKSFGLNDIFLIMGHYHTVILVDLHSNFFLIIKGENYWKELKKKYDVTLPRLNDTKITYIDLEKEE